MERLSLLRHAVAGGHRISNVATLPVESLRELAAESVSTPDPTISGAARRDTGVPSEVDFHSLSVDAVRRMDANQLEQVLTRALLTLGHQGLVKRVAAPLAVTIGELWQRGDLSAAHEHFASAFLRTYLANSSRSFPHSESTPSLVVATPTGQLHELGAVMIASVARNLGWRVIYLGVSLPAAEIAGAVAHNRARAVALSLVYPADDPAVPGELRDLRRYMPSDVRLLVGGRASSAYRQVLQEIGAMVSEDLDEFSHRLEVLRHPAVAA